jgi:hypothetical protein
MDSFQKPNGSTGRSVVGGSSGHVSGGVWIVPIGEGRRVTERRASRTRTTSRRHRRCPADGGREEKEQMKG